MPGPAFFLRKKTRRCAVVRCSYYFRRGAPPPPTAAPGRSVHARKLRPAARPLPLSRPSPRPAPDPLTAAPRLFRAMPNPIASPNRLQIAAALMTALMAARIALNTGLSDKELIKLAGPPAKCTNAQTAPGENQGQIESNPGPGFHPFWSPIKSKPPWGHSGPACLRKASKAPACFGARGPRLSNWNRRGVHQHQGGGRRLADSLSWGKSFLIKLTRLAC
jgi:hypothetical protein